MQKYGTPHVWKTFTSTYSYLPLAAIVDKTKFCCHGGLSPDIARVDDIRLFDRTPDIPHDGGLCDLMWSDPSPDVFNKETGERFSSDKEWEVSPRGAGYYFGAKVTDRFLHDNGLKTRIRAHQLCHEVLGVYIRDTHQSIQESV